MKKHFYFYFIFALKCIAFSQCVRYRKNIVDLNEEVTNNNNLHGNYVNRIIANVIPIITIEKQ